MAACTARWPPVASGGVPDRPGLKVFDHVDELGRLSAPGGQFGRLTGVLGAQLGDTLVQIDAPGGVPEDRGEDVEGAEDRRAHDGRDQSPGFKGESAHAG